MFPKKGASMRRPKMLTTTINRAAFAEKMKQVAESGHFMSINVSLPFGLVVSMG